MDGSTGQVMSCTLHAPNLLRVLNENRKNPALCDGFVQFNDDEIPVQRNVLAAASPYFKTCYQYEPAVNSKIRFDTISKPVFMKILDYIYTSIVVLDEDNIQEILQAADLLLMDDLKAHCCTYMEQCISINNCLGIRDFAEKYSCPRVLHAATNFLDENFMQVSYSEEFMDMNAEHVKLILKRDSLSIQTEDAIFDAVIRWVQHDAEIRKNCLQDLLVNCVYMSLLDERYLQEYVIPDHLIRSLELESLVLELRKQGTQTQQRGYSNMIVVTGGEGASDSEAVVVEIKSSVRCVAMHNWNNSQCFTWINLAPMLSPRVGHGLVQAGGCLYAVGGRDNSGRILNSGEKYDPSTDTWTFISPMHHARLGFGLLAIDDKIYAVGGSNDMSDPSTSLEEYSIYTNKWRQLPDMNLKRAWSSYGVANNKIYVAGGGIMGKLHEAVECYDPSSETWTSVSPMRERRFDARGIGVGNLLYIFGGLRRLESPNIFPKGTGMKFCGTEVYNTDTKNWTAISKDLRMCSMNESSHIDAITIHGDEIVLIGDLEIEGVNHCVRAFNSVTNQWRGVIQNHPANQRGMQACLLKICNSVIYSRLANERHKSENAELNH